jgi:formamidopyrimidine-DNA glycosylase
VPELPEVFLSAQTIKPLIQHQTIIDVYPTVNGRYGGSSLIPGDWTNWNVPDNFRSFSYDAKYGECKVSDIQTKGKFMYWSFSNGWFLMNSFGMSGSWNPTRGKHPCFVFQYAPSRDKIAECQEMVFNDPRHFGTIRFTNNIKDLTNKLNELGWDPLKMPLSNSLDTIKAQIKKTTKSICQMLMDQTVFAGVGNYIKAESLYKAGISPWRLSNKLTDQEVELLCQSIIEVVNTSLAHQGATISTYKTAYGEEGRYSSLFQVYGKKIDPLGNPIIAQITPDKRTTHWCPTIQK